MTLDVLLEAKDSLIKASTPQPFSTSKTSNWVARSGGLPDYIQHVAHGILRSGGGDESSAIAKAIGIVKRWAAGGGKVDANTQAAARKAVAEWEAKKAANKAKGSLKEQWIEEADRYVSTIADEQLAERAALGDVVELYEQFGESGMLRLFGPALLEAATAWKPTMKPAMRAQGESERHHVFDGGQHVGTITSEPGYASMSGNADPPRWRAKAINGDRVGAYTMKSKDEALSAIQTHLSEAPARVIAMPTAGQYMVATPSSYGATTYKEYPNEITARHAAGLPAGRTAPEMNSQVSQVAEGLRFDLMTLSGQRVPQFARLTEAAEADPFDLLPGGRLAEKFEFNPLQPRNFHGEWSGSVGGRNTLLKHLPEIPEAKLPDSVSAGQWDRGATRAVRDMKLGKIFGTDQAHRSMNPDGSLGQYSETRERLHQEILNRLFQGKHPHPQDARAIFTAGGGASGKSSMLDKGGIDVPKDVVYVNPDIVRSMLPEYKQLVAEGDTTAAARTHEEASHVAKYAMQAALEGKYHALVDGVGGGSEGRFVKKITDAQAAGHKVSVHYATVDTAEAVRRAEKRGKRMGRYVDGSVLRRAHKESSERFPEVAKITDARVQVFDNNGTAPKLIADKAAGSDNVVIGDRSAYKRFIDKGKV
jgi:predicted ABC-type ATPase